LFEKRRRLGGSLTLASTVHADNQRLLDWLVGQMRNTAIDIRLGAEADAAAIGALQPAAIVVATGARLALPALPGIDLPHVLTGADLRRLAAGDSVDEVASLPDWLRFGVRHASGFIDRHVTPGRIRRVADWWLPIGRRVAIVGGDLAAIELAEFLAKRGRDVCVLAEGDTLAPEIGPKRRLEHEKRLEQLLVAINLEAHPVRIVESGVDIRLPHGKQSHVRADTVIVAGNPVADTSFADSLACLGVPVHTIGDCTGLGLIVKAVEEGARVAHAL